MNTHPDYRTAMFSFGMNISRGGMRHRCPNAIEIGPAKLPNHRLAFARVATVLPAPNRSAYGVLWAISESDLDSLDALEGFPSHYGRERITVHTDNGTVECFAYRLREPVLESPPWDGYVRMLAQGYRDFNLPLHELKRSVRESRATADP